MLRRLFLALLALALLAPGTAAAAPRRWTAADSETVEFVADLQVAPAGDVAAVALAHADLRANTVVSHYLRIRLSDGATTPLPDGLDHPRWSPHGDTLAWLRAERDGVSRIVLSDGRGAHLRVLTRGRNAVVAFTWSPDGRSLAAVETTARSGAPQRFGWLTPESDYRDSDSPKRELYAIDAATGSERRLTHDAWSYGGPTTDHDPSWSADGRELAVVRQPTPAYGDFEHAEYVRVALAGASVRPISTDAFFAYPESTAPLFAPAGTGIAYAHTWDGKLPSREDLFIDGRDVSAPLDRDLWSCGAGRAEWQPHALIANLMDGVSMRLYRLDETGGPPVALTSTNGSVGSFSVARTGRIVYAWTTPAAPDELFVLDPGGTPRQLTHFANLNGLPVAQTRYVEWQSSDGRTLHGQLTLPRGGNLREAPLVIEPHGGPQCADEFAFDGFAQYLADNGYAYFHPDPRGSDGYGDWSYKAIVGNWGEGPAADIQAGIDSVLASGVSAPDRLFLEGGSYGGYMTAWLTTHSDRFKAAVAQVPVTNMLLEYALSESPNILRRFFGDKPSLDQALLARESPLTYAAAEHTPLLVMIGLLDTRAPYPQAIEFFKAVAENGTETRLLADRQAGHGPGDPQGELIWRSATLAWFALHGAPAIPGAALPK